MGRFVNTQDIDFIEINRAVSAWCPLGSADYAANMTITLVPGELIMDYIELDEFFDSLEGRQLIIEDLINEVYKHIESEYLPLELKVSAAVLSGVHSHVRVSKGCLA